MATAHQTITLDEVWLKLIDGIEYIFQFQTIRYSKWMLLYTHIYNYGTNDKYNNGADLYERFRNYLTNYLENLSRSIIDLHDTDVLEFYLNQCKRYRRSSKILHGICSYLHRHYVRREIDSGNTDICEILPMAMQVWGKVFSKLFTDKITPICLNMIKAERHNQKIDHEIIKNIIRTYITFTVDENIVTLEHNEQMLDVYREYFENEFLEETKEFYRLVAATYLEQYSIFEYLTKISEYFNEEVYRVTSYLHPSTVKRLIKKLEEVLIYDQLKAINDQAKIFVQDEKVSELSLLFQTVNRVEHGKVELEHIVENHIYQTGIEAIERLHPIPTNDLKVYIQTIYDIHQKYFIFIQEAFNSDQSFFDALDRACRKFINDNVVIRTAGSMSKLVEYLARYCDKLLRKSEKAETDIEIIFDQMKIVLYYMQEKDIFEKFYSKMLAKRLINQISTSNDYEKLMISNIQNACGFEYVLKMKQMCQDIETSQNLLDQYYRYCESQSIVTIKIHFSVMILNSNAWLLSSPPNIILPNTLKVIFHTFTDFYNCLQNGRKLIWVYQHSKGELQTYFTKKRYTLQVSMYQMIILLLFNDSVEWTVERIHDETQITIELLLQILSTLLQSNILTYVQLTDQDSKEINLDLSSTLRLTSEFSSDKYRINLNIPMKSIEQKDTENFRKKIDQDRIMTIQATIVRIMKLHKTMNQNLLIPIIIQQLTSHFNPDVSVIKDCINILIKKEYLEQQTNNKDMLYYVT